jgi:hypothetical protein
MLTGRRATEQNLLGNQESIEFLAQESEGLWREGRENTIN